jgi:hypothetical protein
MKDIYDIDPNYNDFSASSKKASIEFDKIFSIERRGGDKFIDDQAILDKKTTYSLYSINKNVLSFVQRAYMQLPFLSQAYRIKQGLVINKGIIFTDEKLQNNATETDTKTLQEFKQSFGGTPFLIELLRILETKGNAIVCYTEDNKFIILDPANFYAITRSNDESIAQYDIIGYGYRNKNKYIVLNPATTIPVWTTPKSVLGIPNLIIEQDLLLGILADGEEFKAIKQNKGYKKTILSAYTSESGVKKMAEAQDVVTLSKQINDLTFDPTKSAIIVNQQLDNTELPTIESDNKFYDNLEIKAMVAANIAGIPPQMLMSGKNINRSNTDQNYKSKIQSNIQPMNDLLSNVVQNMANIWAEKQNTKLEVTIDNPKSNLDIEMNVKDILESVKIGLITNDEARKLLNLNN